MVLSGSDSPACLISLPIDWGRLYELAYVFPSIMIYCTFPLGLIVINDDLTVRGTADGLKEYWDVVSGPNSPTTSLAPNYHLATSKHLRVGTQPARGIHVCLPYV